MDGPSGSLENGGGYRLSEKEAEGKGQEQPDDKDGWLWTTEGAHVLTGSSIKDADVEDWVKEGEALSDISTVRLRG